MELTPKQQRFVDEYLVDLNGTRAAIRAGYSADSARFIAAENLTKPNIRAAIEERMRERAERVKVQADDVLRELTYIAFADVGDIFDFSGGAIRLKPAPEAWRAIASIKVRVEKGGGDEGQAAKVLEFRLLNKIEALRALGRHLGMFTDRVEHTFPGGVPVIPADAEAGRQQVEEFRRQRQAGG
jgi:phage terminase small subunit